MASWGVQGASWWHPGASWGRLGGILAVLGPFWAVLGRLGSAVGRQGSGFGASTRRNGGVQSTSSMMLVTTDLGEELPGGPVHAQILAPAASLAAFLALATFPQRSWLLQLCSFGKAPLCVQSSSSVCFEQQFCLLGIVQWGPHSEPPVRTPTPERDLCMLRRLFSTRNISSMCTNSCLRGTPLRTQTHDPHTEQEFCVPKRVCTSGQ